MTQPAKSQEPSMEEILASIRRIIADDDANKTAPPPQAAAPAAGRPAGAAAGSPRRRLVSTPPEPSLDEAADPEPMAEVDDQASDILDLTESDGGTGAQNPRHRLPHHRRQFRCQLRRRESAPQMPAPPMPEPPPRAEERSHQLLSRVTSAAVNSAFNTLAQTVLVQNARTLEDLVREMLRPMLKAWLDDNLPGMVERLVRAEIERVSRGRMG